MILSIVQKEGLRELLFHKFNKTLDKANVKSSVNNINDLISDVIVTIEDDL